MNHYEISIFKEKPDLFRKQYDNQLFLMSQGESLLLLLFSPHSSRNARVWRK